MAQKSKVYKIRIKEFKNPPHPQKTSIFILWSSRAWNLVFSLENNNVAGETSNLKVDMV
jgi:hypothetical protein